MASPEVLDSSGMMDSVFSEELSAPAGWTKKLMPRKGGTPKRKDVVYVSPDGEEFKNKKQLDKYLKVHPGGPSSADFDWSTGETPRRSARLSSKGRLSSDGTDAEPISKRSRRSLDQRSPGSSTTPSRKGRKSQRLASNTAEDEVMQEAENEQDEAATVETTVPSGSTEDEGPKKEEKEGDKDSEMDAVKAPETEKDSKEITAVGKLESTGQVSDQLGSSEDTGNIGVKEAENEQDECATIGTTVPSGATEDEAPEKEGKKGDGDNEMDSVKAPETGNDSKDVTVVGEVESTGQFNDHLGSSEEPGNIAVKVIAEESVLTAGDTSQADVTIDPDTVMKETENLIEEEKVDTTLLEVDVTEEGDPLNTSVVDAVDEVTMFLGGETSQKEENSKVEETHDAPQNLDGKEIYNPVVNSTTKDEDTLKPKDHVEPQGIHALIEEPVLCGANKPDQTTESPRPAAEGIGVST